MKPAAIIARSHSKAARRYIDQRKAKMTARLQRYVRAKRPAKGAV